MREREVRIIGRQIIIASVARETYVFFFIFRVNRTKDTGIDDLFFTTLGLYRSDARRATLCELAASCAAAARRSVSGRGGEGRRRGQRGNVDSWEMIPLCKGQMEMTLGQPPDRSSLGLFLVRRDDDCARGGITKLS